MMQRKVKRAPQRTARTKPVQNPTLRGRYDRTQSAKARRMEQRVRLLAAAGIVFSRVGYAEASVEDVVKEAGMSRRTFYELFDSLRHLLLEMHDQAAAMAYMLIESQVQAKTDPKEQLRAGLMAFMQLLATSGGVARVLFRETHSTDRELAERHQAVLQRFAQLLFRGADEAVKRGEGSRRPDETTIYALITGIEAVGRRYLDRKEEHRAPEAVPALTELVFRAFK